MLLIPSYLLFCPIYPSLSSLKPLSQSPFNSPFPSISPDFYYFPSFRIIPPPHQSFGILFKLWFNFSILSSVCFWKNFLIFSFVWRARKECFLWVCYRRDRKGASCKENAADCWKHLQKTSLMGKFNSQGIYTFKGSTNSGIWSLPCEVQQSLVDVCMLERQVGIVKMLTGSGWKDMMLNECGTAKAKQAQSGVPTSLWVSCLFLVIMMASQGLCSNCHKG